MTVERFPPDAPNARLVANIHPPGPTFAFPSFPPPVLRDRERQALRGRKRRRILLALLLGICLLALGAWVSRLPDRENVNLPRVTLEVRGMS
jgi:hypothetical protein